MLSLLPRREGVGSISRCLASKRSHSILSATATSITNCITPHRTCPHHDVSSRNHLGHHHRHHRAVLENSGTNYTRRWSSKYASVDHSAAYRESMASSHGVQLQLALEEGRGKDDAPFDPFSQFLDEMGNSAADDEGGEDIEEAEYETIEEHDEGGGDASRHDDDDDEDDEDDEDDSDDDDDGPVYTTTGALHRPKSEKLALRAGYPAGGVFAVVHLAGFQHKVTVDDLLVVNKLKPVSAWSVGSTHTIKSDDVLLMADQDRTLVGLPGVKGWEVDLMVEEITRDKTLVIFKKRRRKNSRRKNGFRRQVTFLRVLAVRMPKGEEVAQGERVDEGGEGVEEEDVRMAA